MNAADVVNIATGNTKPAPKPRKKKRIAPDTFPSSVEGSSSRTYTNEAFEYYRRKAHKHRESGARAPIIRVTTHAEISCERDMHLDLVSFIDMTSKDEPVFTLRLCCGENTVTLDNLSQRQLSAIKHAFTRLDGMMLGAVIERRSEQQYWEEMLRDENQQHATENAG